jgi:hypothetical protein
MSFELDEPVRRPALPPPRRLAPPPPDFLDEGCLLLIGFLGAILFLVIHWK